MPPLYDDTIAYDDPTESYGGDSPYIDSTIEYSSPDFTYEGVNLGGIATISGDFTADAVLLWTPASTFTANALLKTVVNPTFTADALLKRIEPVTFTADSLLKKTVSATFTADSVIFKTTSATFTANAVLKNTLSGSFTADAWIDYGFSADAVIKATPGTVNGITAVGTYSTAYTLINSFDPVPLSSATIPSDLTAGDWIIVAATVKNSGGLNDPTVITTGGQSWSSSARYASTEVGACRVHIAQWNGNSIATLGTASFGDTGTNELQSIYVFFRRNVHSVAPTFAGGAQGSGTKVISPSDVSYPGTDTYVVWFKGNGETVNTATPNWSKINNGYVSYGTTAQYTLFGTTTPIAGDPGDVTITGSTENQVGIWFGLRPTGGYLTFTADAVIQGITAGTKSFTANASIVHAPRIIRNVTVANNGTADNSALIVESSRTNHALVAFSVGTTNDPVPLWRPTPNSGTGAQSFTLHTTTSVQPGGTQPLKVYILLNPTAGTSGGNNTGQVNWSNPSNNAFEGLVLLVDNANTTSLSAFVEDITSSVGTATGSQPSHSLKAEQTTTIASKVISATGVSGTDSIVASATLPGQLEATVSNTGTTGNGTLTAGHRTGSGSLVSNVATFNWTYTAINWMASTLSIRSSHLGYATFTADAVIKATSLDFHFTADAVLKNDKAFTANAKLKGAKGGGGGSGGGSQTDSLTLNKPSEAGVGDILLAGIGDNKGSDVVITPPTDWTLVGSRVESGTALGQSIYQYTVPDSPPSSWTWTITGPANSKSAGVILVVGDVKPTVNAVNGQSNSSSTSIVSPSITTSVANVILVNFAGVAYETTINPPSGMAEPTSGEASSPGGEAASAKNTIEVSYSVVPAIGATGTRTATSANAGVNIGHLIAMEPYDRWVDDFTADAVLLGTLPGTFTADAYLVLTRPATFTADADFADKSFTADALIKGITSVTFTADSVLKGTNSLTFTADSVLVATTSATFTADAYLGSSAVSGTFTADAVILRTTSGQFTADAVFRSTSEGSITADAVILNSVVGPFTADSTLLRVEAVAFTADAYLLRLVEETFTADALLLRVNAGSFTANATLFKTETVAFTADGLILRTETGSFTADARLLSVVAASFNANAVILRSEQGSFTASAVLLRTEEVAFTADARLLTVIVGTFNANSVLLKVVSDTFTGNAVILATIEGEFTADARLYPYAEDLRGGHVNSDDHAYDVIEDVTREMVAGSSEIRLIPSETNKIRSGKTTRRVREL